MPSQARCEYMGQRFLSRTLLLLLLIGLLLSGLALWGWTRMIPPASLTFQGPDGPVALHRVGPAQWRIEAVSPRDEAFAEGVLDGLDAAPLLIFRRAAAYGKLEALIGPEAAIADAWVQSVDLPARVHPVWAQLDEETRARLQAYADGVNTAWQMGPFLIRRLPQPDPLPEPWRPWDSVAVAVGLALAHPGWMEAEISASLQSLPAPLRTALADPLWNAASRVPDAPMREAAWRAWTAIGAAPEAGLFRGCREGDGFRLHAMAAPVLPLPWRVIWVREEARVRWPGLPGAPARATASGGRWLKPTPGPGDPLHTLGELIQGIVKDEAFRAFWAWDPASTWPPCAPARATHREVLLALPPEDWLQRRVHGMLRRWDGHLESRSPSALVYAVWREEVIRGALQETLGTKGVERLLTRRPAEVVLTALLAHGETLGNHPERILQPAYRRALRWIGRRYGDLHTIWAWGKAHAATLRVLGWPIQGEMAVGGDEEDLWPTPVDPTHPYRTAFWPAFTLRNGPPLHVETAPVFWGWPWP